MNQRISHGYDKPAKNNSESKETYGQTRGLSNQEMNYVGKLAIIGALLKAKQVRCAHRGVTIPEGQQDVSSAQSS